MTVHCNCLFGVTRLHTTLRILLRVWMKNVPWLSARNPHFRSGSKPARIIETPRTDTDELHSSAAKSKQWRTTMSAERTRRRVPAIGDYLIVLGRFGRKPKTGSSYYDRRRIPSASCALTVAAMTIHHRDRSARALITNGSTGTATGEM
jgi:hypothetical protein